MVFLILISNSITAFYESVYPGDIKVSLPFEGAHLQVNQYYVDYTAFSFHITTLDPRLVGPYSSCCRDRSRLQKSSCNNRLPTDPRVGLGTFVVFFEENETG